MYKRKQKPPPTFLSFSTKSLKKDSTSKPPGVVDVVNVDNNENDSGHANDIDDDDFDENAIPASQQYMETTQRRYFSQRSNANRSQPSSFLGLPGNTTNVRRIPNSYFENTLLRCGVTFDHPQYIVIGCDHITFVNKLRTMLESASDYPANIEKFVTGLKEFMKDEQQMTKVLTVCMIKVPNFDFLPQSQDCLMRNFLMIETMEEKIVEVLLETLATLCSQSNPTDQIICSVILILTQLGFVNKRNNAETIYSQIVALLGLVDEVFRNEIIKFLPDILDVRRHDCVVEKLISLMDGDPHKYLNEVTVSAFETLQLSPRLRSQLKMRILTYIQDQDAPLKLYAPFTKFLLDCQSAENHLELNSRFRKIDWTKVNDRDKSLVNETQKEVFQFIVRALTRSKELSDNWLKSILNCQRVEDFLPSDVIVLILMSSVNEDRSLYLEGVLRRKIKSGHLTRDTFSKAITGFPLVIAQHLKVFFEFIDNLFRMKDEFFEFGEIGYKLAFGIPNCDHKLLLSKLVAFVCEKSNDFVVRRALILLQEIFAEHPDEVQIHSLQILRILDKVNDVGLFEYRLIMDLLSAIAYPPPPALPIIDGIATQIDILVRKQVTGSGNSIRRQGIVGSVRVIDHLVWHQDFQSANEDCDTDATVEAIEDLLPGNGKSAANAVNLMLLSSENNPLNRSLCFDELAAAFSPRMVNTRTNKFINRPFLGWCKETVTMEFQELFIVDDIPEVEGVTLDRMFKLNRNDEYTEEAIEAANIAVNIGGLVFDDRYKTRPVIANLAPIFSLVRILTFHACNGDLENINALLGCAAIFPQFINSPEDVEVDSSEKGMLLMDIFFYTANWFREIICAFASQRELNIRKKVLLRLTDLISLEGYIRKMLKGMPHGYCPPKCHFMTTEGNEAAMKKPKGPAKEGKETKKTQTTSETIPNNSTLMAVDQTMNSTGKGGGGGATDGEKKSSSSLSIYGPKEIYRQLDLDILYLLKESLCTSFPLPRDKVGTCLGLAEYKFIVEDLILKLESVTAMKKGTGFEESQFMFFPCSALMYDMKQEFLGRFMQFFDQLSSAIQRNQELRGNESSDTYLYSEEMNLLKRAFGLTLRLLAALFSWQGFHQEKHDGLLKEYLMIVLKEDREGLSIAELAKRVTEAMTGRLSAVLDLYSAVHLYHLVVALASYTNDHSKAVGLCGQFLKRQWFSDTGSAERGGDANTLLNELLKGMLKHCDLAKVKKYIRRTLKDLEGLKGKEGRLQTFPNFTKANFPILFRALANSVYELTVDRVDKDLTSLMRLEFWESVYEAQNDLLDIVRAVKVARNFPMYLRYSQLVLKLFLQHGMPAVESSLKTHTERVKDLLKSVQGTTRFLHRLCCQSKSMKNASVISLIPGLRQSVESFNYAVKAALVANKCSSAFLLANLKNNNMEGEEILSQMVTMDPGDGDEDEEPYPSDDETVSGASYMGITTMCIPSQAVRESTGRNEAGEGTSRGGNRRRSSKK